METCKIKHRNPSEVKQIENRIRRIEGQLNGIRQMIDQQVYCDEVLIQISAAEHSIKSLGRLILANHLRSCVKEELLAGNESIIDEVMASFRRLES
ncbi:MAG: metal-sensing transcriptional repressor [Bacilli bacterium]